MAIKIGSNDEYRDNREHKEWETKLHRDEEIYSYQNRESKKEIGVFFKTTLC